MIKIRVRARDRSRWVWLGFRPGLGVGRHD